MAINLEGVKYFDIKGISVNEYHLLSGGEGKPCQVHLWFEVDGIPHPFVVRFKSRKPVDELIVALMVHAEGVWPKEAKCQIVTDVKHVE